MSLLRKDNQQDIVVDKSKDHTYAAFFTAASKLGKVTGGNRDMGTLIARIRGNANMATVRLSFVADGPTRTTVQFRSESLDGAVGFGSAGSAIDRLIAGAGDVIAGREIQRPSVIKQVGRALLVSVIIILLLLIFFMAGVL